LEIGKIAVARRLLDEAIRGAIRGDDPLTIHLGTMSAFSITKDIRRAHGLGHASLDPHIRADQRMTFWASFFRLNSAIKHADRDPDALVDVGKIEAITEMGIILTLDNLRTIDPATPVGFWGAYYFDQFATRHPEGIEQQGNEAFLAAREQWAEVDPAWIIRLAQAPYREGVADFLTDALECQPPG
jgi:hypothetical protein